MSKGFWRFTGTKLLKLEIPTENVVPAPVQNIEYETLPMKFVPGQWPNRVNTACSWCSNFHDNIPIPHIKNIEMKNDDYIVMVDNFHYCSWNCYRAYAMEKSLQWQLVVFFASIFYPDISISTVYPALPKTVMKKYGGRLSQSEYNREHVVNKRTQTSG